MSWNHGPRDGRVRTRDQGAAERADALIPWGEPCDLVIRLTEPYLSASSATPSVGS